MRLANPAACLSIGILLAAGCARPEPGRVPAVGSDPPAPVLICAASSLTEVVTDAVESWSKGTGRTARPHFGSSSMLARQIREGAPADVFVSADPRWMDSVTTIARHDWLGNRLACVVPAERRGDVDLRSVASLALGGVSIPVGMYARVALEKLGVPLPERTICGQNVRDVLSKVAEGAAEAGIVYATDVPVEPRVRLAFLLPEESHPPIRYVIGLIRPGGKDFFEALRSPAVLEAASRRGFTRPGA